METRSNGSIFEQFSSFAVVNKGNSAMNGLLRNTLLLGLLLSSAVFAKTAGIIPPGAFPLKATAVSTTQIDLSWGFHQEYEKDITGFLVERQRDGDANWVTVSKSTPSTRNYQDSGLDSGTQYRYRVSAVSPFGDTGYCGAAAKTKSAAPKVPTHLTQAQALQIAKAFCGKVGNPITVDGDAAFSVPKWDQDTHWLPRWHITFPEQAEVEIIDATGAISDYTNETYSNRRETKEPAGDAIPEADAIQAATAVKIATGQVDELAATPRVMLLQGHNPPLASDHTYLVIWQRIFDGIPYDHQQLTVSLDAETGEITGLGMTFPSQPPTAAPALLSVLQDKAKSIARNMVASAGLPADALESVKEEVVQPNRMWEPGGYPHDKLSGPAHVVWACRFKVAENKWREVWVDAQTGQVVGGTIIEAFAPHSVPPKKVAAPSAK